MNIFFTGSIRGGRENQPKYAHIVKLLEQYGTVFSKHVADEKLSEYGETNITNTEILERELRALANANVIVADVTTPSHGVGYMISRASALGKRVIALHNGAHELKLSGIIQGDPQVEVHEYKSDSDVETILEQIFKT